MHQIIRVNYIKINNCKYDGVGGTVTWYTETAHGPQRLLCKHNANTKMAIKKIKSTIIVKESVSCKLKISERKMIEQIT